MSRVELVSCAANMVPSSKLEPNNNGRWDWGGFRDHLSAIRPCCPSITGPKKSDPVKVMPFAAWAWRRAAVSDLRMHSMILFSAMLEARESLPPSFPSLLLWPLVQRVESNPRTRWSKSIVKQSIQRGWKCRLKWRTAARASPRIFVPNKWTWTLAAPALSPIIVTYRRFIRDWRW